MASLDELRQQAQAELGSGNPDPWRIRALIQKLSDPADRELVTQLSRRMREATLARAEALAREAAPDPGEVINLNDPLKALFEFKRARELLDKARSQPIADGKLRVKIHQQLALCTYKDEELDPETRFRDALAILSLPVVGLHQPDCNSPETLGLGGAVYKRKWEHGGQVEDLETALYFYRRGWLVNPEKDMGYCGVNAAYIMDLLAHRSRTWAAKEKADPGTAAKWSQAARKLREEMRGRLPGFPENWEGEKESYWYKATMAEVYWGLGDWDAARDWLAQAKDADHDEWTLQTTTRQLVSIASMAGALPPRDGVAADQWHPAWQALRALLGEDTAAATESHRGKVGLALSGGGFRASLFHLGVLARLAECDVLRSVEVLSTVSGGSIVGAHYYLALRHRLQTNTDAELTREEYIALVQEITGQFFAGVQKNLRVSALANLWSNLRMLGPTYGRSNRMGELYEEHLYARVKDGHWPGRHRRLCDLLIHPLLRKAAPGITEERDESFKPKFSNWRRRAKVPILLLNATSLNSGHNWHFTASWMGEPPGLTGQEVDMNERYRRLYYWQAPTEDLQHYPLGYAVAASAGVPALFDPLVLRGLYPGRTVKLVDGGVHDNQGVAGLLDEGCTLILCSDASGQMDDQDSPASNPLAVFFRSDSILQDRLREAQYQDLAARQASHALQGLFFIHLKQELDTDPIDWVHCQDPGEPTSRGSRAAYGVDRTIQKLLSEVRTDLDSFTEVEALSLMASGYLMTEHRLRELDKAHAESGLKGHWAGFDVDAPRRDDWPFIPLLPVVAADPDGSDRRATDLAKQLKVSKQLFFKVWLLVTWLRNTAIVLAVPPLTWGVLWTLDNWHRVFTLSYQLSVGEWITALVLAVLGLLLPLAQFFQPLAVLRKWLFMVVAATFGWFLAHLHLRIFDPLFKRRGRLGRLMNLPAK